MLPLIVIPRRLSENRGTAVEKPLWLIFPLIFVKDMSDCSLKLPKNCPQNGPPHDDPYSRAASKWSHRLSKKASTLLKDTQFQDYWPIGVEEAFGGWHVCGTKVPI